MLAGAAELLIVVDAVCCLPFIQQRVRESLPSGGAAGVKSGLSWMAGLVVVGDEILSGKVEDSNISFLCTRLYEIGWTVRKVRGLAVLTLRQNDLAMVIPCAAC